MSSGRLIGSGVAPVGLLPPTLVQASAIAGAVPIPRAARRAGAPPTPRWSPAPHLKSPPENWCKGWCKGNLLHLQVLQYQILARTGTQPPELGVARSSRAGRAILFPRQTLPVHEKPCHYCRFLNGVFRDPSTAYLVRLRRAMPVVGAGLKPAPTGTGVGGGTVWRKSCAGSKPSRRAGQRGFPFGNVTTANTFPQ